MHLHMNAPQVCEGTRVIKKFSPHQPGAIKLARRYGPALVCVRYRESADGETRFITVELLIEQMPLVKKKADAEIVAVEFSAADQALRRRILANGGQWDARSRTWLITRGLARRLRLMTRVRKI
jgi:hypothetical protein